MTSRNKSLIEAVIVWVLIFLVIAGIPLMTSENPHKFKSGDVCVLKSGAKAIISLSTNVHNRTRLIFKDGRAVNVYGIRELKELCVE